MRPWTRLGLRSSIGLVLAVGLAACGASGPDPGNGGNGADDVRQVGLVRVTETVGASSGLPLQSVEVTGLAAFAEFDAPIRADAFASPWADIVDTCDVFTAETRDPLDELPLLPDGAFRFLDVGDAMEVFAAGQADAFLRLERSPLGVPLSGTEGSVLLYESTQPSASGLPTNLTSEIGGGGAYPAVSGAALPATSKLILSTPVDPGDEGAVDIDTVFRWSDPTFDDATVVRIDISESDFVVIAQGSAAPQGGPVQAAHLVTCYARDDGEFALPHETVQELARSGRVFSGRLTAAGRETVAVRPVEDDARLISTTSRRTRYESNAWVPASLDE